MYMYVNDMLSFLHGYTSVCMKLFYHAVLLSTRKSSPTMLALYNDHDEMRQTIDFVVWGPGFEPQRDAFLCFLIRKKNCILAEQYGTTIHPVTKISN